MPSRRTPRPILPALALLLCLAVLVGCGDDAVGPDLDCVTTVDLRTVEEATTWGADCSTVEVLRAISVEAALVIVPGTTVRSDQDVDIHINPDGSLNAAGTESEPIVFEGMETDRGFWSGISISSRDPANVLRYVTITDAGGEGWHFHPYNLTITGTSTSEGRVLMENVEIRDGAGIGLVLLEGGEIEGSTNIHIEDLDGGNIQIAFPEVGQLHSSFTTRTTHAIIVTQGHLKREATIPEMETPMHFQQGVQIRDGGFLIVEAGNELGFEQDVVLSTSPNGRLALRGTEDKGVVLYGAELGAGYWGGLVFESFSPDNEIRNAGIFGAGGRGWQNRQTAILVTGDATSKGMLTVENTQFREIDGHGIEVLEGGVLTASGNTFEDIAGNPIEDHNP